MIGDDPSYMQSVIDIVNICAKRYPVIHEIQSLAALHPGYIDTVKITYISGEEMYVEAHRNDGINDCFIEIHNAFACVHAHTNRHLFRTASPLLAYHWLTLNVINQFRLLHTVITCQRNQRQRRDLAASIIQRCFHESIANPQYAMCKKRLMSEFNELVRGV